MALLYGPSEKQREVIQSQLGETDELFEENMKIVKNWIVTEPNIPKDYDRRLLPLFLRGCKHNIIRTKNKLEKFHTSRATCEELYGGWDPLDIGTRAAIDFLECSPLPNLTDEGYRVVIHRIREQDDANLRDIIRMILMLVDLRLEQEHMIAGDIFIFDIKNTRVSTLVKLASPLIKRCFEIIHTAYPQRLQQVHIINAPTFTYNAINLFKSLMTKKIKDRFITHASYETLLDYIPARILPSEYSGQAGSFSNMCESWIEKLKDSKKTFQDNDVKYAYTRQTLHKQKFGSTVDLYGVFKALDID